MGWQSSFRLDLTTGGAVDSFSEALYEKFSKIQGSRGLWLFEIATRTEIMGSLSAELRGARSFPEAAALNYWECLGSSHFWIPQFLFEKTCLNLARFASG